MLRVIIKIILIAFFTASLNHLSAQDNWAVFYKKASLLQEKNVYDSAYHFSLQALKIAKKKFANADTGFIDNLTQLGGLCIETQRWDSAKLLLSEARELTEKNFGKNNLRFIQTGYGLMGYYFSMGMYPTAIKLQEEQTEIVGLIYGTKSLHYVIALNDLAVFNEDNGRFSLSESYFKKAKEIVEINFGIKNTFWVEITHNTADLYMMMGRYGESEAMFKTAISMSEKMRDSVIVGFPLYLNNLARLYLTTGRYEDAVPLLTRAYSLYAAKNDVNMISPLGNLASAYILLNKIEKADSISKAAELLSEKMIGRESMDYAAKLRLRATVMQSKGNWNEAEKLLQQYLELVNKIVGDHHYLYATGLFNLACIKEYKHQYSEAAELFTQALSLRKENEGQEHPVYAKTLSRLASSYDYLMQFEKAEPLFADNIRIHLQNMMQYFNFLSDSEREKYLATLDPDFNRYKSFYIRNFKINPKSSVALFNTLIATRGMLLNHSMKLRNAVVEGKDEVLLKKFNEWVLLKKEIGRYSLINKSRLLSLGVNLDSLISLANQMEKEISQKVNLNTGVNEMQGNNWTELQKKLSKSDASVEFMHYRLYQNGRMTDSIMYAALVARPGYAYPKVISLFEERELRDIMEKMVNYRGVQVLDIPMSQEKSRDLYALIWASVDSLLKGVKNVYYAPSGLLHKISFAGLSTPDKKYLIDRYSLKCVTSSRSVGNEGLNYSGSLHPHIYGGIRYTMDLGRHAKLAGVYNKTDNHQMIAFNDIPVTREIGRGSEWSYLQGTLLEAAKIAEAFRDKNIQSVMVSGDSALEESFKAMSGNSPEIIHIATHGFFFSKKEKTNMSSIQDNEFKFADDPLLRSGLVMAGGNRAWTGSYIPDGMDDGILTAYEVSLLDLSKTKLVVLSACETGLGDIRDSEGVYGLQRAFKMAGVQYIIFTLWEIRDEVTVEFMEIFYTQWIKGKDIHAAFRAAQEAMRAKYEANYWAAFVLSE